MNAAASQSEPTYNQILGLSQTTKPISCDKLKAAYHRALLLHHPDKKNLTSTKASRSVAHISDQAYSIDQITEAYKNLSSAIDEGGYDDTLKGPTSKQHAWTKTDYHDGVETFDLEDLSYSDDTDTWLRTCRCGDERAYTLSGADLEREAEHGEIYAACKGCSLLIRVLFDTA